MYFLPFSLLLFSISLPTLCVSFSLLHFNSFGFLRSVTPFHLLLTLSFLFPLSPLFPFPLFLAILLTICFFCLFPSLLSFRFFFISSSFLRHVSSSYVLDGKSFGKSCVFYRRNFFNGEREYTAKPTSLNIFPTSFLSMDLKVWIFITIIIRISWTLPLSFSPYKIESGINCNFLGEYSRRDCHTNREVSWLFFFFHSFLQHWNISYNPFSSLLAYSFQYDFQWYLNSSSTSCSL